MLGRTQITRAGLARTGIDASLAALYALFAWAHWFSFRLHHRPSLVLMVLVEALFACFTLVRRSTDEASRSPWDWTTTVGGTLAPLVLRPAQVASDLTAGEVIQAAGVLLAVVAVLSLNRSLGFVPAHRGVKTGGLYRWVRHPLYLSYTVSHVGYLISNFTVWNAFVVAVASMLQVLRIANEERYLSRYPDYCAYKAHTRWRILPHLY